MANDFARLVDELDATDRRMRAARTGPGSGPLGAPFNQASLRKALTSLERVCNSVRAMPMPLTPAQERAVQLQQRRKDASQAKTMLKSLVQGRAISAFEAARFEARIHRLEAAG